MQIVHYIPHSRFKITVFRSGNRFIVKFDDSDHDMSVKFREGEVNNLNDVVAQVDEKMLEQITAVFSQLSDFRADRFKGLSSKYPEII